MTILGTFLVAAAILTSCGNNNQESANNSKSIQTEASTKEKSEGLHVEFLGNYQEQIALWT